MYAFIFTPPAPMTVNYNVYVTMSSQSNPVSIEPFLPEPAEKEQACTSIDLHDRNELGEPFGHSRLLVLWGGKYLSRKFRPFS